MNDEWLFDPCGLENVCADVLRALRHQPEPHRGLWHVTTARDAVLAEGLKSRAQLGRAAAGGGSSNLDSNLVSVTYSVRRAERYLAAFTMAARAAQGRTTIHELLAFLFDWFGVSASVLGEDVVEQELCGSGILVYDYSSGLDFDLSRIAEEHPLPDGPSQYDFLLKMSNAIQDRPSNTHGFSPRVFGLGITTDFTDWDKVFPEQVSLLEVELRRGSQIIPHVLEDEIRVCPSDVRVRRVVARELGGPCVRPEWG